MKRLLYVLIMCIVPTVVIAQRIDNNIVQAINKATSQMKYLQCDFTQTKHLRLLNDKMVSKGKMYYRQPDKLRWQYNSPYTYTFILNDTKVLLKKDKRNDVIDINQNKMFKEIARIMMNSVVGKCLTDDKSFKTSVSTASTEYIATLIPQKKDMRQMWTKLVLHLDREKSVVTKVEMYEKGGDYTVIELSNIQINKPIDVKIFSLQ